MSNTAEPIFSTRNGASATVVWKRILEVERNCEFETITAAQILTSKFLSVIGKSTGDIDFKKKVRKSDMSVEALTEALHEYMYEKLNNSPETEDQKKIRYLNKRKTKSTKQTMDKPAKPRNWTVIDAEHRTGLDSTNVRLREEMREMLEDRQPLEML